MVEKTSDEKADITLWDKHTILQYTLCCFDPDNKQEQCLDILTTAIKNNFRDEMPPYGVRILKKRHANLTRLHPQRGTY